MKKDIMWLKDEILTDMQYLEGNREIRQLDIKYQTLREVAQKIISLDEPEVLSQKFINEKAVEVYADTADAEVHVVFRMRDLQNLLVPKQEVNLKIQELIEKYEQEDGEHSNPENAWIDDFIYDLKSLIEKEQKYCVLDKDNIIMIGKVNNGKVMKRNFRIPFNNFSESAKEEVQLTEQEIKDHDERYWPFAVPVEEADDD